MTPSRVAIIGTDYPTYELYCPNWIGMQDGLKRLGIEHRFFSCRPALSVDALCEYAPDLVVYGLIDLVRDHELRIKIRERLPHAKIVLWYGDFRHKQMPYDCSELDMMFVSNDAQSRWYEKVWQVRRCEYLPLGSPLFDTTPDKRFAFPFVFIGSMITGGRFMERAKMMLRYKTEEGLKVIDGPGHRPDLREKVFRAMPTIYRSSAICLDISHFTTFARYTSNRHWIITASGGFAFTKRFPGCELDYPEGTRAYFDTFEESLELRDRYTKDDAAREKIRAAGQEHAKNHTYDHRFNRMFELLYGA